MLTKGYLHLYCGEGKGKTSILNGMVLRALGANKNLVYIRFLKNRPTNENVILEQLGVPVHSFYQFSQKFIWEMNPDEVVLFKKETLIGYDFFCEQLQNPAIEIILADEILGAVENGFIDRLDLIQKLQNRCSHQEIILSGRYSYPELDNLADLISEVQPKKHYFNQGLAPRNGLEF